MEESLYSLYKAYHDFTTQLIKIPKGSRNGEINDTTIDITVNETYKNSLCKDLIPFVDHIKDFLIEQHFMPGKSLKSKPYYSECVCRCHLHEHEIPLNASQYCEMDMTENACVRCSTAVALEKRFREKQAKK